MMNRIHLLAFVFASCLAIAFCLSFSRIGASRDGSGRKVDLEHKINPNNAPSASLARLPAVGLSRANAIVEYRRQFRQKNSGDLAFRDCNDLRNAKGIGPGIAENMCQYLKFDGD